MFFDTVLRTAGVITSLYAVAYFVTTMSIAALNGVSYSSGPMCGDGGCVTLAARQYQEARYALVADERPLWTAASFLKFN